MPATKTEENLIKQLFDSQPDSVVWFEPVYTHSDTTGQPEDFVVGYCNTTAAILLGHEKDEVIGAKLSETALIDDLTRKHIVDQCSQVWQTGESVEFTYHSEFFDKYFNVQRSKVLNGVLSITRDKTPLVLVELEKDKQTQLLNKLIENSPYGVCLFEAIRSTSGEIEDFQLKICNQKGSEISQFTIQELYTNTFRQLCLKREYKDMYDTCQNVVTSGQPVELEQYSRLTNKWISYSIVKFEDGFIINYFDITASKEQNEELKSILDASISGVCAYETLKDDSGEIIDFVFLKINKRYTEMIHLKEEDVLGKRLLQLFPYSETTGFFNHACNVITTGEPHRMVSLYNADGLNGWYELSLVKMGENKLVVTFNDITESVNNKKSIEKLVAQLQTIVDTTQTGIGLMTPVVDDEGKILDFTIELANRTVEQLLRAAPGELIGSNLSKWLPTFAETDIFKLYCETFSTGSINRTDLHFSEAGQDAWLDVLITKVDSQVLITFHDYTSLKSLQDQLEQTILDLKRSNDNLKEFAYAASHDLQEPLRKINVFSNRLKRDLAAIIPEESAKIFERMESAATRMSQLIDDLLAYSQLSTKPSKKEPIELPALLQNILSDLEAVVAEKNAKIEYNSLPVLKADAVQFRQLFQNLLSNSLKYTREGVSPLISVVGEVVTNEENGAIFNKIVISDNGIGFDQEHSEKIFGMFQRLHGRSEYPGNGVGLAIAYKVVENHKGSITAVGKPGEGATFIILLPQLP